MSTATVSANGRYRYRLSCGDLNKPAMLFIMLNPSTADAFEDDQTIRKCKGFAEREGYMHLEVVNLCALRCTKPEHLLLGEFDPVGPDNDAHVKAAIREAAIIVAAWGAPSRGLKAIHYLRTRDTVNAIGRAGKAMFCLGKTKKGHPRHPLYLRSDAPLERFP